MRNVAIRTYAALCLMILLAGCVGPVGLSPLLAVPVETPMAAEASALPTTELPAAPAETKPSATVEEQLDTLTYWIGHWRAMRLSATPADDAVLQEVINLLVESAAALELVVDAETLASVDAHDAAEALVRQIANAIGARYGVIAQATFEIRYATQVADLLLWFVTDSMPAEEVQARSHAAANYLSAALHSAQRAGLQGPLLTDGLQLARNMARGAEPLEASRNVFMWRIRVLAWIGGESLAASTPAPTAGSAGQETLADEGAATIEVIREPDVLFLAMGCIDCHYLEEPEGLLLNNLIAPSLANLPAIAAERVAGQDAVTYVHSSIVDPDVYVVEGYEAGIMPLTYADEMTAAEIDALVKWLLDPERE